MALVLLGEVNGVILSMDIDAQEKLLSLTLDPAKATAKARLRYPDDGSKVDVTVGPGDLSLTRTFVGGNRLTRIMDTITKPVGGDGTFQRSPAWSLESA